MAGNRRTLTLEEVRRRAADLDGMFEDYQEQQALESRFSGVASTKLVESWGTGKNEDGKRMTRFEWTALSIEWMKRFGSEPPWDTAEPTRAPQTEPEPPDDKPLSAKQVAEQGGLSLSTLKRRVQDASFPQPQRPSPRRVVWPAGDIKVWRDRLDSNRRSGGR